MWELYDELIAAVPEGGREALFAQGGRMGKVFKEPGKLLQPGVGRI
jgi:hypothetical protein